MSSSSNDVVVLEGCEFKRVKNGLDETQVAAFVDELVKERNKLVQSQDHIASLNRLAERAIVEADKLALQIKTEATEHAKAESAAIIDKAREQARQMAEKMTDEAVERANEKANAIKAKAEEEAAILLKNEKDRIRNDLRNLVNEQFGYLLDELERLKQQAAAIQADFDGTPPKPREDRSAVTAEIVEKIDAAAAKIVKKSEAIAVETSESAFDVQPEPGRATAGAVKDSNTVENASTVKDSGLSSPLPIEEQPRSGKPQWEVEILPPFNISKIMEVVSFLDQLPEVANTEMIVPQIDMPLILVFLRKPMNVVEVLQKIPAVASVEEVTVDKAATNGRPRKVRMSLSGDKRA
jgi:cell division septum initiation protein DivIVA